MCDICVCPPWTKDTLGISQHQLCSWQLVTQWISDSCLSGPAHCYHSSNCNLCAATSHWTFLCSADCCGVAFKGQSDTPCGSAVISDAAVSTETSLLWVERSQVATRWHPLRPLTVTAAALPSTTATRYVFNIHNLCLCSATATFVHNCRLDLNAPRIRVWTTFFYLWKSRV